MSESRQTNVALAALLAVGAAGVAFYMWSKRSASEEECAETVTEKATKSTTAPEKGAETKPAAPKKVLTKPTFSWESNYDPKPRTEPPCPTSAAAKNRIPNAYKYAQFDHPKIAAARTVKGMAMDWSMPADTYPTGTKYFVRGRDSLRTYLCDLFTSEIAMYDGAMGTMIQKHKLEEEDYRGERYKNVDQLMKGNNDMLSVTKPEVIKEIYTQYLEAGSNMIGTNTFSSTTIAQADYELESLVYELNYHGARLAREACDEMTKKDPSKPRFVCGAVGPTNRTGSISPDVEDPASRNVTFDELVDAYYEQVVGLMDGGADILIVETIFDTLNAKAAVFAIGEYLEHTGLDVPLIISGTLVDQSGRTLSGQTG